jgi:DNA-directed RNA polymerase subunit RPC12/RpoP
MINLKCTSCGGTLTIPDNLSVAHCIYCGAKILITEADSHKDNRKIKSYIDLCEQAIKSKNYQEALDYSNRILEIDSKNFDAWTNKAIATFWLTTGANFRYDEAMSYIDKAEKLDPGNPRIVETKKELTTSHAWYKLGYDTLKQAREIYKIWSSDNSNKSLEIARKNSKDLFVEAGNYFLKASLCEPDNIYTLWAISSLVSQENWIPWNDEILNRAQYYDRIKMKKQAIVDLPKYKEELKKAEIILSEANEENRFYFAGKKVKEAEERVKQLKDYIASLEKLI